MKRNRLYQVYLRGLYVEEYADFMDWIHKSGGGMFFLSKDNGFFYPHEFALVAVPKRIEEFPISPDYVHPIKTKEHLHDVLDVCMKVGLPF